MFSQFLVVSWLINIRVTKQLVANVFFLWDNLYAGNTHFHELKLKLILYVLNYFEETLIHICLHIYIYICWHWNSSGLGILSFKRQIVIAHRIFRSNSNKICSARVKMCTTDHNKIVHTSRQCNCRDVCKISLYLFSIFETSIPNFDRISNSIKIALVGRAPGPKQEW